MVSTGTGNATSSWSSSSSPSSLRHHSNPSPFQLRGGASLGSYVYFLLLFVSSCIIYWVSDNVRQANDSYQSAKPTWQGTSVDDKREVDDRIMKDFSDGVKENAEKLGTKINEIHVKKENDGSSSHHNKKRGSNEKDLNIILFYADDWTWRTIGAVNKYVKTPNLDQMVQNGILFSHNCVTTSICWQSRASMVTGLYTSQHKQFTTDSMSILNETIDWTQTLYPLLKRNGYHTGYIGKWHAPMPIEFQHEAFNYYREYYGDHWMEYEGKKHHVTELNGLHAMEYLKTFGPRAARTGKNNQFKFALTISFFATHAWDGMSYPDQFMPQPYSAQYYEDNEAIPEPKTATPEDFHKLPYFLQEDYVATRARWYERYNTPNRYQVTMNRIYRMASEVDDVVGEVMKELQAQGLYEKTLLIFTTDNGVFHGEHQLAGKWFPHEESIRVPLIIQDPRMADVVHGTTNDAFTLNIDLAPTILSAAGISVPKHMQGRDIADLYLSSNTIAAAGDNNNAPQNPWRNDFFYEWTRGDKDGQDSKKWLPSVFALINKEYKYFHWPVFEYEQIFHVSNDPYEESDIFNSTKTLHPDKLAELLQRYSYLKEFSQSGQPV